MTLLDALKVNGSAKLGIIVIELRQDGRLISNGYLSPIVVSSTDWEPIGEILNRRQAIKVMAEGGEVRNLKTGNEYFFAMYENSKDRVLIADLEEGEYIEI